MPSRLRVDDGCRSAARGSRADGGVRPTSGISLDGTLARPRASTFNDCGQAGWNNRKATETRMGGSILVVVVRGRGPGAGRGPRRHLIARVAPSLRFAFVLIFIFIAGVRGFHHKRLYAN